MCAKADFEEATKNHSEIVIQVKTRLEAGTVDKADLTSLEKLLAVFEKFYDKAKQVFAKFADELDKLFKEAAKVVGSAATLAQKVQALLEALAKCYEIYQKVAASW
ncbi:unnamed protein product [Symbiodinium sp. CCMP2592]|nr:unnamed protein product [Symbiodinium sp. CCMP2592]